MSSTSRAWSRLAILGLVLSAVSLAVAQTVFNPQGGEYSITGALPGDQVQPQLAIGRAGGFVVWQDNLTDEDGLGISAQILNSSLSPDYGRMRINEVGAGDQEKPKVALLAEGGAVFVWQSGTALDRDIRARFLTAARTFATGDLTVNTFTNGVQQDAAVAVLPGGGAVVVWSSWDQDGDLQGVYGQLFSSSGQKQGGEFRVNQFTAHNQRNPAVSVLPDGGFVVAWVSELQHTANSVDVYARLFSAAAEPRGNEFRVNDADATSPADGSAGTTCLCVNPTVSGRPDGGFLVAWSQRDFVNSANGWDVYFRNFGSIGAPLAGAARLNDFTQGDQYWPQFTPTGAEHLAVWTSMGQDGSWEGIYGRFIGGDGQTAGAEFQVNTTWMSKQMQPAVAVDGYGRLMVAWTGFKTGAGFDVFAQRYDAIRPVPTPAAPHVAAFSSSAMSVNWSDLAGFEVGHYEVRVNGGAIQGPVFGNGVVVTGFLPATPNTFELACVLADGRRSAWSDPATGATWGADLNGDGIPDDWQTLYFGKSAAGWPGASADSDGDGASDYNEFLAGTNPLDAASVLRSEMSGIDGQLRFAWSAQPGMVYQVQVSTNLVNWTDVGLPRFAAGTTDSVPIEKSGAGGFYRVIRVR